MLPTFKPLNIKPAKRFKPLILLSPYLCSHVYNKKITGTAFSERHA
jgi:hypothetical protein